MKIGLIIVVALVVFFVICYFVGDAEEKKEKAKLAASDFGEKKRPATEQQKIMNDAAKAAPKTDENMSSDEAPGKLYESGLKLVTASTDSDEIMRGLDLLIKAGDAGDARAWFPAGHTLANMASQMNPEEPDFQNNLMGTLDVAAKYLVKSILLADEENARSSAEILAGVFQTAYNQGALGNVFGLIVKMNVKDLADNLNKLETAKGSFGLGLCYLYGLGAEQNTDRAKEAFEKSASAGSEAAAKMLTNPLFDEDDEE